MNAMKDDQLETMRNDPTSAIFDYQVSSAERFKHANNKMFMNGSQDSADGLHPQQICHQAAKL